MRSAGLQPHGKCEVRRTYEQNVHTLDARDLIDCGDGFFRFDLQN